MENIWFTEHGANKVAKVTTSGVVTESPTAGSGLAGIAAAPDGLWITELNANRLAKVTTSGMLVDRPPSWLVLERCVHDKPRLSRDLVRCSA